MNVDMLQGHPAEVPSQEMAATYVPSPQRAVLTALSSALLQRRGLTVLTGPQGVGKSYVLDLLRAQLPPNFLWCSLAGAPRHGDELYAALRAGSQSLRIAPESGAASGPELLRQRAADDCWTVLVIDDGDELGPEIVGEIDKLASLEPMLQVVLVARDTEFLDAAAAVTGFSLEARVRVRLQLEPIAADGWQEALDWWGANGPVTHRLPFDADAVGAVGSAARGLPGRMFELAARATEVARQQWVHVVSREHVQLAANAFGMPPSAQPGAMPGPAPASESVRPPERPRIVSPASAAGVAPGSFPVSGEADPFRESPSNVTIDSPQLLPVLSRPHSIEAEWFRVLQVRLDDWVRADGGGSKTILITGANVSAGKTLVAVNLALQWAHNSWQRVLLIDGDLRRPQFHALFEIPRRPGLADVLAGRCSVDEATAFISETGLHVLPAGRPGNPRQLVNPDRIAKVFAAARESFDIVIVDSPPLSAMVDSRSMAATADGVLMVVRAGSTPLSSLQKTLDYLPADNLIGAIVNGGGDDKHSAYAEYRRSVQSG